ncbi:LolA family protein [Paenibacillus marinisediminis]
MRRFTWVLTIMMSFAIFMAGCGQKDAASVVKELDQKMNKLESYAGIGTMILYSGQQPLEYQVEVWYQDPSYYRIELTNAKKDVKQIVLRNDEGVFVLTPSLKKSFRFQSDWPDNQGQVYLYQTLVHSILSDNNRQFLKEGDSYIFEVAANYQTDSLVKQKIWLNSSDYKPKHVQVTDAESRVVLEMKFSQFEFDKRFDKDAFDMQRNMSASANIDPAEIMPDPIKQVTESEDAKNNAAPTTVPEQPEGTDKKADPADNQNGPADGKDSQGKEQNTMDMGPFGMITPTYTPEGVVLKDNYEVPENENHAVLLRYTGAYNYTIMESRPKEIETGVIWGRGLDLGFTVGQLVGEEQKTLTWMEDGVKYRLTTNDLPDSEMVKIAQSMVEQPGK